jgi:hypothetical protein
MRFFCKRGPLLFRAPLVGIGITAQAGREKEAARACKIKGARRAP